MPRIARLTAVALLLALAACNTVEGLGKDVKTGGQVITNEAQQTRDTM